MSNRLHCDNGCRSLTASRKSPLLGHGPIAGSVGLDHASVAMADCPSMAARGQESSVAMGSLAFRS